MRILLHIWHLEEGCSWYFYTDKVVLINKGEVVEMPKHDKGKTDRDLVEDEGYRAYYSRINDIDYYVNIEL
jgi:hypothetical protein